MKKIFLLMLVAMVAAVSCQKSELTTQNGSGDEVTVNISAVMQSDNATTRVIDDNGKATEINRCIMEIYTSDEELYQRQVTSVDESLKASFSINLVPDKTYDFVFWADCATDNGDGSFTDIHYTTNGENGLKAITANYSEYDGNDEKRDAFFATVNQTITASESNVEAKLYRPFGQVNVSTYVKDLIESYLPTTVQVEYTSNNIATTFNAFDGTTDGSTDIVWKEAVGVIDNITAGSAELFHLSTDYIFAPKEGQALIDFKMEFFNDGASIMTNDKFTSIPVQRNYRTNISGNLLTIGSDITVEVVPTFNEPAIEVEVTTVETVEEVANVLAVVQSGDDANVTVTGTVTGNDNHIEVPAAVEGTTGETSITVNFEDVDTDAEISFGGDTKDDESDYDGTVYITAPEGVEFTDLTINLPNAHIVFNGEAQTVTESASGSTFVVAEGAKIGTLTVNAGNVIVYGTVETINYDNTISKVYYGVSTVAELTDVISKYDGAIFKNNISGVDATNLDLVTITKSNFVLDGAGFTLSGQGSKNNVLTIGGEDNHISGVVVKDLIIEQDGATVANNGMTVYASEASLENVTIQNCGKAALIVNAGEVTATDFYTSGNVWGGVNVSLGSGSDVVGMTPKFYFVSGEISEDAQIWVDGVDSWEVTTPEGETWYEGWVSETVYMYSQTEFKDFYAMEGEGTQESPYLITMAQHLVDMADLNGVYITDATNSAIRYLHFRLENDIDMDGIDWTYIYRFMNSSFDGNNKTISNLKGKSLFCQTYTSEIYDLTLESITTTSGGLTQCAYWDGTFDNVKITSTDDKRSTITSSQYVGGLVSLISTSTEVLNITNCSVDADISGPDSVGGILGSTNSSDADQQVTIDNCRTYGNYEITTASGLGGIVGQYTTTFPGGLVVKNCKNYAILEGGRVIGGIVGSGGGAYIENCENQGNITATNAYYNTTQPSAGGITGTITVSYSDVTYNGKIVDCANYGDINIPNSTAAESDNIVVSGITGGTASTPVTEVIARLEELGNYSGNSSTCTITYKQ